MYKIAYNFGISVITRVYDPIFYHNHRVFVPRFSACLACACLFSQDSKMLQQDL